MTSTILSIVLVFTAALASSPSESGPEDTAAARVAVPEPTDQAMEYYHSGNVLWIVGQVVVLAVPAVVLFSGLSARWRSGPTHGAKMVLHRCHLFRPLLAVELRPAFSAELLRGFVRQHALWHVEPDVRAVAVKSRLSTWAITIVFGSLVLWFPYWLMRRSPRRWWLYSGLASLPLMFFVMFVEPIWIAPLYNHFGPMHDKKLEAEILDWPPRRASKAGGCSRSI